MLSQEKRADFSGVFLNKGFPCMSQIWINLWYFYILPIIWKYLTKTPNRNLPTHNLQLLTTIWESKEFGGNFPQVFVMTFGSFILALPCGYASELDLQPRSMWPRRGVLIMQQHGRMFRPPCGSMVGLMPMKYEAARWPKDPKEWEGVRTLPETSRHSPWK